MTRNRIGSMAAALAACGTLWCTPGQARGQQSYGIDFVTVGAPGNAAYHDPNPPEGSLVQDRGGVSYSYRIGRLETTTSQWMEFLNAYAGVANPNPFWNTNSLTFWGAHQVGNHYALNSAPNAGLFPVTGITWRMAGLYCNWLTGGKGSNPATLVTGAYDTTTWGDVPNSNRITDAPTHLPGAQFWIPTLDEQIKAMHYDPNRYGQDQGGWWRYKNSSDSPPVPGPPGVGTTSSGYIDPVNVWGEWQIPLGSYPGTQTPWGLLDATGGAAEWSEQLRSATNPQVRSYVTSHTGVLAPPSALDGIEQFQSAAPRIGLSELGLRIATVLPAPSVAVVLLAGVAGAAGRRTRRIGCSELQAWERPH